MTLEQYNQLIDLLSIISIRLEYILSFIAVAAVYILCKLCYKFFIQFFH